MYQKQRRVRFCVQHQESFLEVCSKCAPLFEAQRQYENNLEKQRSKRTVVLDRTNIQPSINGLPLHQMNLFRAYTIPAGRYWTDARVKSSAGI